MSSPESSASNSAGIEKSESTNNTKTTLDNAEAEANKLMDEAFGGDESDKPKSRVIVLLNIHIQESTNMSDNTLKNGEEGNNPPDNQDSGNQNGDSTSGSVRKKRSTYDAPDYELDANGYPIEDN
ncbi:hypothetical protein QE152_g15754 [Popillia japonica]|uniref:Uncharacterized protein n=1 Tax=Popillia japonica TaxID=7064 RepID=A0AAW1L4S1_POPJA